MHDDAFHPWNGHCAPAGRADGVAQQCHSRAATHELAHFIKMFAARVHACCESNRERSCTGCTALLLTSIPHQRLQLARSALGPDLAAPKPCTAAEWHGADYSLTLLRRPKPTLSIGTLALACPQTPCRRVDLSRISSFW